MVNTWVKNQLRDAWVDSGVHDGRIECSRSPEYAYERFEFFFDELNETISAAT